MKKRLQGIIAGILIGATATGGIVYARTGMKTIDVMYNNIKVYKDNVLCELKDANGTVVEPFIYNGTTYLPVRGTASIADMDVTWDGNTQSVYLWDELVANGTSFIDVCPPYDKTCVVYQTSNGKSFSMAGEKYSDGITFGYSSNSYALFNLNSKYSTIECTVGHFSNESINKTVSFIVDGKVVKEVTLDSQCLPKKISVPVKYGLQLKIVSPNGFIGIGNMTVK